MRKPGILILASLLTAAVSCGEKTPQAELTSLTVSPTELSFVSDDASNKLLLVSTTTSWSAQASAGWIHLDKTFGESGGSVSVSVDPNEGTADRTGSISFTGAQSASVSVTQKGSDIRVLTAQPDAFDGNKRSSTTYQLLIYSFADSDSDGVGDFRGIISKLDYLDALGVTALWLSPAHPTSSYHAYDVNDYFSLNPLYGTEQDFQALIDAAHAKGIKIYMDYVLNHSGKDHPWFKSAAADPESAYRDYYVISKTPDEDAAAGRIDNYGGARVPGMGSWSSLGDGKVGYKGRLHFKLDWTGSSKTVTVTQTDEPAQSSNPSAKIWLWIGSNAKNVGLYETSDNIFEITLDVDTDWGFLVRTSTTTWDGGTKWGGRTGSSVVTFGEPLKLDNSTAANIVFGETSYYFGSFGSYMPDLNYGPYSTASESAAFKDIASSADKWIRMGVDGFRLDAVLWIYQAQVTANQSFLKQWYDRCNETYRSLGHSDDIFMVGEAWEAHSTEKLYYKGINSCFEFEYFGELCKALGGNAASYVSTVNGYLSDHTAQRSDAITSIFMTNHDQNRAAESLGKNLDKEKQAAAMLLTTPGKPFIYQGEELGYWGSKDSKGDVYVRTPILWDKAGKDCARKGVENNVDNAMLTSSISVEAQSADEASLLRVYQDFSRLRNTYPAAAAGAMSASPLNGGAVASWYLTSSDGQKLLVVHNCGSAEKSLAVSDDITRPVAVLGTVKADRNTSLILSGHASVVFLL